MYNRTELLALMSAQIQAGRNANPDLDRDPTRAADQAEALLLIVERRTKHEVPNADTGWIETAQVRE